MNRLLAGIRVLDFGRYIAGPYCASVLGFLGAEVIRIERPGGGEDRPIMPVTPQGDGALFLQMNANKLGMTLDIAKEDGREVVRRLVQTADVVIANFPPDTLAALGLDYETLAAIKSDIILTLNTAYGSTGPFANKVGFDGIAQAMSGAAYFSGEAGKPVKTAVQYVDFSTALAGVVGTLAALMHRERSGEGQQVETSLLATALSMTNGALIEQAVTQVNRVPSGNQAQVVAPSDIFATKDGFVLIQIAGRYLFRRWARLMGREDWLENGRFSDDTRRGEARAYLCEQAARWCEQRTTAEAVAELDGAKIPASAVLSYQQALDNPMVQALAHLIPTAYPDVPIDPPISRAPFALSKSNSAEPRRAPLVGEHTEQILQTLGYDGEKIEQLRKDGVI